MKKLIFAGCLLVINLVADVITATPYIATINYDSDPLKSEKDKATLFGVRATIGDLNYLIEADLINTSTQYKPTTTTTGNRRRNNTNTQTLNQQEIALSYSKYYEKIMFRVGGHYINSNDEQLGNGNVILTTLGGYKTLDKDRYNYGIQAYYSYYSKGHDENYTPKAVQIMQFTPYFSFYKPLTTNLANTLLLKLNYQIAPDYIKENYTSYEISDTIHYKSLFATLYLYGGEMRTGVKDDGVTIFNTLDLMKRGYNMKVGYYITKAAVVSISYGQNSYEEYGLTQEATNSVAVVNFNYGF